MGQFLLPNSIPELDAALDKNTLDSAIELVLRPAKESGTEPGIAAPAGVTEAIGVFLTTTCCCDTKFDIYRSVLVHFKLCGDVIYILDVQNTFLKEIPEVIFPVSASNHREGSKAVTATPKRIQSASVFPPYQQRGTYLPVPKGLAVNLTLQLPLGGETDETQSACGMSSQAQPECLEGRVPYWSASCKDEADTTEYGRSIFLLVERLLHQEQQSKLYQGRLESRINADSASYQRLRAHCTQLERMVSGVEYQKSQLEASLRHTMEVCQTMSRELGFERGKVQELQSRLSDLHPAIDSLLQRLSSDEQKPNSFNEKRTIDSLLQENQQQRELISWLQSTVQAHERTVQELRVTLDQVERELPPGVSCEDERDKFTIEEPAASSSEEESCVEIITEKPASLS